MQEQKLTTLLNRITEMEKLLATESGTLPWTKSLLKTIGDKPEFILWKKQLMRELENVPQEQIVKDTLTLLGNGFQTGFSDEQDFRELKSKLTIIAARVDQYEMQLQDIHSTEGMIQMKKGTTVQTAFDEYTLIQQVGQGGNGRVFSAQNANGDSVAIKFVARSISADKLKRFKNEIHFCEHNQHKNIVKILDRGYAVLDATEYVFYVMPLYLETLRDKIKRKISPADALTIFTGILEGLSYAHKNNTIHRDIKPENIMFEEGCLDPIICDFGIAHFAEEELLTIIETKKGDRLANFQYAAPEQKTKGASVFAQTDIYAVALILNEMFTGEVPQAADYKTISSVAPEYGFMDEVFALLFRQQPSDRLYPEEKILTEMKVRAENHRREQEKHMLQQAVDNAIRLEDFNATIIKKEFVDGRIIFTMNCDLPQEWFQILSGGHLGSYSSLIGYGPEALEKNGRNAISITVREHVSGNDVKRIVENVIDWIPKANARYSALMKEFAQREQRERENARKAEIAKLERESSISAILAQL